MLGIFVDKELLDFVTKIAWPLVALVGILILGPGGVLQKIVGQLAENLFRITDAVKQFKETAADFHKTQGGLKESTQWVAQLESQLHSISGQIESIHKNTEELAISEGTRSLERAVGEESTTGASSAGTEGQSVEDMFVDLRARWDHLVEKLKASVGPDEFDARSVGQMAWKLVDNRRRKPLKSADAELFERLYSQMKRFNRLQNSKDEWLTYDIYSAFVRGIEQADAAL